MRLPRGENGILSTIFLSPGRLGADLSNEEDR